jgi:hypothetical protein
MKLKTFLCLVLVLSFLITATFADSAMWSSRPLEGVDYKFEVFPGKTDQWNSAIQDSPPLLPAKAILLAKKFVLTVPLPEEMSRWELNSISIEQMQPAPEEWIYIVTFSAVPKGNFIGQVSQMKIPVRFDGTIPKPTITKQ